MKTQTFATLALSLATAVVLLVGVACASNPSQEVKDTRLERSGDISEHNADTNDVYAKDDVETAKSNVALENTTDKLDDKLDSQLTANDKRGAEAHADVKAARKVFHTEGHARIARVEAKLADLVYQQAKRINQPAAANIRTQATAVKAALTKLDAVGDEGWFKAMTEVDANLTALEGDVAKLGS